MRCGEEPSPGAPSEPNWSRKRLAGAIRETVRAARGKYAMLDSQTTMEIFVADDDSSVCDALTYLLTPGGFRVMSFGEGASLLTAARARAPACILLDIRLPDKSGLEVLRDLNAPDYPAPIIVISGHCNIPMAIDAIKHGAFDLIEKPFAPETMLARVRDAVNGWRWRMEAGGPSLPPTFPGRHLLTPRELEVLGRIAAGAANKEVARALGISTRTVEVHRAHIMAKLDARNAADLMRLVLRDRRGVM
jgi:two-component system, LuxR family, response regulator FixJ